MVYTHNADFMLTPPQDETQKQELIKQIENYETGDVDWEPMLEETLDTDELYVQSHSGRTILRLCGESKESNVWVNIEFPLSKGGSTEQLARDLADAANLDIVDNPSQSGLFLEPSDFDEVRKRTADAQGRVNLGMDKAGEDVKVVIMSDN